MERLLRWLDDCDDLLDVVRVNSRSAIVTVVLLVAFVLAVGTIFLLGPPDLLAAH